MSNTSPQPPDHPPQNAASPGGETAAPGPGRLTRITVNLTPRGLTAITAITTAAGNNRTDAINYALHVAASMLRLAHPDGTLHVLAPDGTSHIVHLP